MVKKLTPNEFSVLSKYVLDISGIALEKGKEYLIETRLNPLIEEMGCSSYSEFYHKAKNDLTKKIEKQVVDAITTNETYFFRDASPFDMLQHKIIPDLIDKREAINKGRYPIRIRIWSAASSTGQELYSIAIVLSELMLDPKKYQIKLVGTDISNSVIAKASYGKYNKFEIGRGLSPSRRAKFFDQVGEDWRIKDQIRSMVMFKKLNLMEPFVGLGKFDIVFFRNVAIYFTPNDRRKIYDKIAGAMEKDGYLLIGSTESCANDTKRFVPARFLRSIYYSLKE